MKTTRVFARDNEFNRKHNGILRRKATQKLEKGSIHIALDSGMENVVKLSYTFTTETPYYISTFLSIVEL